MKCYYHQEAHAVGVCKNCNKGLCPECNVDVGNGIACKNSCEQAVTEVNALILKNKGVYQKTSASYYRTAVFYGLCGFFFMIYSFFFDSSLMSFLLPLGIIFLVGMAFVIRSGMQIQSKENTNSI